MICRKVLIVLEVSVLKTANEVVGRIGDPKPINVESKPEQQQQHQNLQQNVSGPVQRNMSGRKSVFTVPKGNNITINAILKTVMRNNKWWFNLTINNLKQSCINQKPL